MSVEITDIRSDYTVDPPKSGDHYLHSKTRKLYRVITVDGDLQLLNLSSGRLYGIHILLGEKSEAYVKWKGSYIVNVK